MTTLFLIRHGQTDYVGKRIAGYLPGIHLNLLGQSQAQSTASIMAKYSIQAIFASPLERTQETAAFLGATLKLRVTLLDFLKEVNFGELQGLGVELNSLAIWQDFKQHPARVKFPGGESIIEAQERIVRGLSDLARQFSQQEQIICVAHGEIIRLAITYALGMPLDECMRLTIDPASISCVDWDTDHQTIKFLNSRPEEHKI